MTLLSTYLIFKTPEEPFRGQLEDVEEPIELEDPSEYLDGPQILAIIAKCESGGRQFDERGEVIMSPTSDVGYFQINWVHWERAESLGIDLWTLEGNIEFGELLYKENGVGPWYMSKYCWGKHLT